jgi:exonuclease SbcD
MTLKILHTSDWHIGQLLHGEERFAEQRHMLDQITQLVMHEQPDLMLLAGDIYDVAVPNTKALRMLSDALMDIHRACPEMTIVAISGNHDSAVRHEVNQQVWQALGVHMIGSMHNTDIHQHIIPILSRDHTLLAYVAAVPYAAQRMISDDFYQRLHEQIAQMGAEAHVPILFVGHLAASTCQSTGHSVDTYSNDTIYIGNIETMNIHQLGSTYDYIALGHIHKAQNLTDRARYCGSPIAMSFDEVARDYRHGVTLVEIDAPGTLPRIREEDILPLYPLVNIPAEGFANEREVLDELERFPEDIPARIRLKVLLANNEILSYNHKQQVRERLLNKQATYCETHVQRLEDNTTTQKTSQAVKMQLSELQHMQPIDVAKQWMQLRNEEMTPELEQLFIYALQQAQESDCHED